MARKFYEAANFVIESIRTLGFDPHPQSRIMRMHQALCKQNGTPSAVVQPGDPNFEIACESMRDIQQLEFIFDQLLDQGAPNDIGQHVRRMLGDSVFPQDDRIKSRGRDAQCELLVAAICTKAELGTVTGVEPDIQCTINGQLLGLAVKRIKSDDRLEQNIRKGAHQVQQSKLPGIIVADISLAFNPENRRIEVPITDERFMKLHIEAVRRIVDLYHDRLQHWIRAKGVLGLILHDHQVRLHPTRGWEMDSLTTSVRALGLEQDQDANFASFVQSYERGLPT